MRFISLLFLVSVYLISCNSNEATLNGTVSGMSTGDVYLIRSGDEVKVDTLALKDGKFIFKTTLAEPTVYMINFGPDQQPGFFIMEPGTNTLTYEVNQSGSLQVEGGKEQKVYNDFIQACRPVFGKMDSLGKLAMSMQEGQDTALMFQLQEAFFEYDDQLKTIQKEFLNTHTSGLAVSFIAINYLNESATKNYKEAKEMYDRFDKKTQENYFGKKIKEMLDMMKGTSIGEKAPEFTLPNDKGELISLSSYKGKVVLVDFWASWCGPCRAENPVVVAAYKQYHPKGLEIIGVSLDESDSKWKEAIKKDGLTWTHLSDLKGWESEAAALYNIQSIPANVLVDADGNIIAKDLRGEKLLQTLEQVFANK